MITKTKSIITAFSVVASLLLASNAYGLARSYHFVVDVTNNSNVELKNIHVTCGAPPTILLEV